MPTSENTYQHMTMPAEWEHQEATQIIWPTSDTDWGEYLNDATNVYIELARHIASDEKLLIVCKNAIETQSLLKKHLSDSSFDNITFFECDYNDTWARDSAFITIRDDINTARLDFRFNGWGDKFPSKLDNEINKKLFKRGILNGDYVDYNDFVLEGGSIVSDGNGTIITTSICLLAPHRNQPLSKEQIEDILKKRLNAKRVLWIDYGRIIGDDTDGHIDNIVRLAPNDTLLYMGCDDINDPQYNEFSALEQQLKTFRTIEGKPYNLVKIPMPKTITYDGERLPASYINFVITNKSILLPTFDQPELDTNAKQLFSTVFPNHKVIGIDARALIRQHGSLHCISMNL